MNFSSLSLVHCTGHKPQHLAWIVEVDTSVVTPLNGMLQ